MRLYDSDKGGGEWPWGTWNNYRGLRRCVLSMRLTAWLQDYPNCLTVLNALQYWLNDTFDSLKLLTSRHFFPQDTWHPDCEKQSSWSWRLLFTVRSCQKRLLKSLTIEILARLILQAYVHIHFFGLLVGNSEIPSGLKDIIRFNWALWQVQVSTHRQLLVSCVETVDI